MKKGKNKKRQKQKFLLADDTTIGLFKLKRDVKNWYGKYMENKKKEG